MPSLIFDCRDGFGIARKFHPQRGFLRRYALVADLIARGLPA